MYHGLVSHAPKRVKALLWPPQNESAQLCCQPCRKGTQRLMYSRKKKEEEKKKNSQSRRESKCSKVVPCALSRQRFALSIGRLELFGVVRGSLGSLGRASNIGMKMPIFRQSSRVLPG